MPIDLSFSEFTWLSLLVGNLIALSFYLRHFGDYTSRRFISMSALLINAVLMLICYIYILRLNSWSRNVQDEFESVLVLLAVSLVAAIAYFVLWGAQCDNIVEPNPKRVLPVLRSAKKKS